MIRQIYFAKYLLNSFHNHLSIIKACFDQILLGWYLFTLLNFFLGLDLMYLGDKINCLKLIEFFHPYKMLNICGQNVSERSSFVKNSNTSLQTELIIMLFIVDDIRTI